MLAGLFWIVSAVAAGLCLYRLAVEKDLFGLGTYLLFGVYVPLFLSFCDWSSYHVQERNQWFYYLFIVFGLAVVIFLILPQGRMGMTNIRFVRRPGAVPVEVYNLIFAGCVLLENWYLSGRFFPSLAGIDIHTQRMPYIYFLTTGVYLVAVLDLLEFHITRRPRFLAYLLGAVVLNVVSKSARVDAFLCILQIMSLWMFLVFSRRDRVRKRKPRRLGFLLVVALAAVGAIRYALDTGNHRMNHFGQYTYTYAEGIGYHGPQWLGEVLPYYYGYFALSFDNLAHNLEHVAGDLALWGPNTFRALWFGLFQFDNLFGLNGSAAPRANEIRCAAAAVTTGFWDLYYDYGLLLVIPVAVSFFIYMILRRRVTGHLVRTRDLVVYFYWVPLWFLMSFDNRVYDYQVIWHLLILYLVVGRRYTMYYDQHPKMEQKGKTP